MDEKQIFELLMKIKRKKNLNIISRDDYEKDNIPDDYPNVNHEEFCTLYQELLTRKYIYNDAVGLASRNHENSGPFFLIMNEYPKITVEGNNFLEYYCKNSSTIARIKNLTIYFFALIGAISAILEILKALGLIVPKCQ